MTGSGSVLPYNEPESRGVGCILFRFLHAADIHLDSPLRGLERYEGAPVEEIRAAPRRAFERLVQFAIDECVAFVLLAGDLYDGDWKDYNTGLFFVAQMKRLEEAGIGVHLIAGNHDAASQITKQLALPRNVTLYAHSKPQTVELPELGVAIHGQSFKSQNVTKDLAADYPLGAPDRFDIGLLHTALTGRDGHDPYAPTSVGELTSKGYDYWALGHVHQREIVSEDPWIVFPGNLQGRHARETGAKGATLVTVEAGDVRDVVHHAFDVVRWMRIEVDLESVERADEVPDAVRLALETALDAGAPLIALRLVLVGRSAAHAEISRDRERWIQEIRGALMGFGATGLDAPGVFLEKVLFETRPAIDVDASLDRDDAVGDLLRLLSSLEDDTLDLSEFVDPFRDLRKKLPLESVTSEEGFDPTDPERLKELLPEVRDLLLSRLASTGEGA
jgi:exonuclease SbcD